MESQLRSESTSSKKFPFLMQHLFCISRAKYIFICQKKPRERDSFKDRRWNPVEREKKKLRKTLIFVVCDLCIQMVVGFGVLFLNFEFLEMEKEE